MDILKSRESLYLKLALILLTVYFILEVFYIYAGCDTIAIINAANIGMIAFVCIISKKLSTNQFFWILFTDIIAFTFIAVLLYGDDSHYSVNLVPGVALVCQWDYENKHVTKRTPQNDKAHRYAIALIILVYLLEQTINYFNLDLHFYMDDEIVEIISYFNFIVLIFSTLFSNIAWFLLVNVTAMNLETDLEQTDYIANHDSLTGLKNRKSLHTFIEKLDYQKTNYSLLLADIDYFKKINDTYGHDCGDSVLVEIGNIIKNNVRRGDHVYRWGGEEIVIIMPNADIRIARERAEQLRAEIENQPYIYQDKEIHFTITIGVSSSAVHRDFKQTLKEADNALYYGKEHGRNCVVCEQVIFKK